MTSEAIDDALVPSGGTIVPPRQRTRRRWLRGRVALVVASLFVGLVIFAAVLAPFIAPYDPNAIEFDNVLKPPSASHLLGGDSLGRDVLSRLIFGARTSMLAALIAVGIMVVLGFPLGIMAGYRGGRIDSSLSHFNDAVMSLPGLIVAVALVGALGPSLFNAMLAVGIIFSPRAFRVARAAAMEVRHETFIEASDSIGCTTRRIVTVHVVPNVLSPLLIVVAVSFGSAILAEAGLTYIGLGTRPPTSSWGGMLLDAAGHLHQRYLAWAPGLALLFTVAAFLVLGDATRDLVAARRTTS